MYENELKALKKAGRFRERKIFDEGLIDFASNDYLGLANNKKQFNKAVKLVQKYDTVAPKASMLINGYHSIHRNFEKYIAKQKVCRSKKQLLISEKCETICLSTNSFTDIQ